MSVNTHDLSKTSAVVKIGAILEMTHTYGLRSRLWLLMRLDSALTAALLALVLQQQPAFVIVPNDPSRITQLIIVVKDKHESFFSEA